MTPQAKTKNDALNTYMNKQNGKVSDIYDTIRKTEGSSLSDKEKRAKVKELRIKVNDIYRQSLDYIRKKQRILTIRKGPRKNLLKRPKLEGHFLEGKTMAKEDTLKPILDKLNITQWRNVGFTGKGITIWNTESATSSHGKK